MQFTPPNVHFATLTGNHWSRSILRPESRGQTTRIGCSFQHPPSQSANATVSHLLQLHASSPWQCYSAPNSGILGLKNGCLPGLNFACSEVHLGLKAARIRFSFASASHAPLNKDCYTTSYPCATLNFPICNQFWHFWAQKWLPAWDSPSRH